MKSWRKFAWLLTLALLGPVLRLAVGAQALADPLPLPAIKSPVDTFRALLRMTPEQRKQALADRPEEMQQGVLTKLREYEALTPEGRDLRLRATELRWWLLPLMQLSATNRVAQLKAVPPDLRKLVDERLALWDLFSPQLKKGLLEKEETARLGALTVSQRRTSLAKLPPERRAALEAGLARWRAMTEDQRRATCEQFDGFFTLTEREQKKVLSTFSEAERQQMDQTLRSFETLPLEQRRACVRSFEKFANLSLAEREQFLKNAERWQQMSPAEREAWRNLVKTAPDWPPLPPDSGEIPPLPPGLPPPPP
jgi:hypothetical protein